MLAEKLQHNQVGGSQPADVSMLVARASQALVGIRSDPRKVSTLQRLLRLVLHSGWKITRLLTKAGMAVLTAFLNMFPERLLGWVCAILAICTAVNLGVGFLGYGFLSGVMGGLWGKMVATVFSTLMSAMGLKMAVYWARKAEESDLYYKTLNQKNTVLANRATDLRNVFFKIWNGYSLLEWKKFQKQYAYLGLSDADLGALLRIKATKSPAEFQAYMTLLDKQYHEHHRGPGAPLSLGESTMLRRMAEMFRQTQKEKDTPGLGGGRSRPTPGGRRQHSSHVGHPHPRQPRPTRHRHRAAYAVLDALVAM